MNLLELSQTIRKVRQTQKMTVEQLARRSGFSKGFISQVENFRITPDGFVFCYNPYEIGCYALGSVEVAISRAMLDDEEDPGNE